MDDDRRHFESMIARTLARSDQLLAEIRDRSVRRWLELCASLKRDCPESWAHLPDSEDKDGAHPHDQT